MPDWIEYTSPEFVCARCGVAIVVQMNFRYERLEMRCPKCRMGRVETSGSACLEQQENLTMTGGELLSLAQERHPNVHITLYTPNDLFIYKSAYLLVNVGGCRAFVALVDPPPDNLRWEGVLLEGDTYTDKVLQAVDLAVEQCQQNWSAR